MVNNVFDEFSQSHYSRKILQTDSSSSSSFDISQPSFIALLCIISILTFVFIIIVIIFCYRHYSHQGRIFKCRHKHDNKYKNTLSIQNNQQSIIPISITPISAYSVRSTEHLFSNYYEHDQTSSIDRLPSRRLQQSIIDAYLNDLNSFQTSKLDVNQLKSYLFIDLHSTSSETSPDNISKIFSNNNTYDKSIENENQRKYHEYLKQQRRRSTLKLKQSYNSRFIMRERSLPNNLHQLPQLRQINIQQQQQQQQKNLFQKNNNNNNNNIRTIINQDLQSNITDDYDSSHAYHVNQNHIMQTINEEKPSMIPQNFPHSSVSPFRLHYDQEPYLYEKVSTSHGDDSDIEIPYQSFPILRNGIIYTNDSIIV
ncbi:unnamed protein product [Rotaria sordida]|uniref:Uncharacterized protein n=1 Tax=Rotaria sordida TaxID=392033 RepID=A0A815D0N4_9BILA|nr:unnamed protein product [Rotaria sordida]CAF3757925.1 unnamed protein product [Rotaria sordida]